MTVISSVPSKKTSPEKTLYKLERCGQDAVTRRWGDRRSTLCQTDCRRRDSCRKARRPVYGYFLIVTFEGGRGADPEKSFSATSVCNAGIVIRMVPPESDATVSVETIRPPGVYVSHRCTV